MKTIKLELELDVHDDCSFREALVRVGIKARQLSLEAKTPDARVELPPGTICAEIREDARFRAGWAPKKID